MQGKPGPTHDVALTWTTFTQAAEESGMSRRYAGLQQEMCLSYFLLGKSRARWLLLFGETTRPYSEARPKRSNME